MPIYQYYCAACNADFELIRLLAKADDPAPYIRGINSVQLLKDGDRWWIVNLFWDFEREGSAIPEKYLKGAAE